jgi:hypothetical protein
LRRARRGRLGRGIAAGLAGVLVAGAAALAWEQTPDDGRPRPASPRGPAATFRLDFHAAGDGTLAVDSAKGRICVEVSGKVVGWGAELRYADPTEDVVVVYLSTARRPWCHPIDPGDAARLLDRPGRHYVTVGPRRYLAHSELEPFGPDPRALPDVGEIVCSPDGAVAMTSHVRAQEDGVHLRFYAQDDRWRSFNLVADDGSNEGGRLHGTENVSTFGPGPLYAGCFERPNDAPMSPRDRAYARLTIVDPHGLWTDDEPDCPVPDKRPSLVPDGRTAGEKPDYGALIREHVSGVAADDVIERPLYPGSEHVFETRMVVRGGRQIASVTFARRAGDWVVTVWACPGSGLAREQRL